MKLIQLSSSKLELSEKLSRSEYYSYIASFVLYILCFTPIIFIIPKGYILYLIALSIPVLHMFLISRTIPKTHTILFDKISKKVIAQTTNILGGTTIRQVNIDKINAVSAIKTQPFSFPAIGKKGFPNQHLNIKVMNDKDITIYLERKSFIDLVFKYHADFSSKEEKMIPGKLSKFLDVPLID